MNSFELFEARQAANQKVGNTTTKMSQEEIKEMLTGKLPKWIRELTPAQQKKYALLLRRFTIDKKPGKKPEIWVSGYKIPTVLNKKHVEEGIQKNLSIEEIMGGLKTNYAKYHKEKVSKKTSVKTSKKLKSGIIKEKPLIGKLEKVLGRNLTDREKETAIFLAEKLSTYKWSIEEISGLFENKKFQEDMAKFEPWDVKRFGEMTEEVEKRTYKSFFPELKDLDSRTDLTAAQKKELFTRTKAEAKKNRMALSAQIRQADNLEFIDFLKANKTFFKPKKANEKVEEYLKNLFTKVRNFAIKNKEDIKGDKYKTQLTAPEKAKYNKEEVMEFLMDDKLSTLEKGNFGGLEFEINNLDDLHAILDKATTNTIVRRDMSEIRKEAGKEKKVVLNPKLLKQARDDEKKRVNALLNDLYSFQKKSLLDIPPYTGQMDINKYITGLFTKLNLDPEANRLFSRDSKPALSSLSTGAEKFDKPSKHIATVGDLADYLKQHYVKKVKGYEKISEKNEKENLIEMEQFLKLDKKLKKLL